MPLLLFLSSAGLSASGGSPRAQSQSACDGDELRPRQDLAIGKEDVRSRGERVKDAEEVCMRLLRLRMLGEEVSSSKGLLGWYATGLDKLSCCAQSECLEGCAAPP